MSVNKLVVLPPPIANNPQPKKSNHQDTGVFYSGARNIYFSKESRIQTFKNAAPKVHMGTTTVQVPKYIGTVAMVLTHPPADFPRTGQLMPLFKHTLIVIDSISDNDCKIFFTKQYFVVYDPQQQPLITVWREHNGAKLWRISLLPFPLNISTPPTVITGASLKSFSAYDLPRVEALVQYFRAESGFPVIYTCLCAIKCGN